MLTGIQVSLEKRGDGRPYLALRSAQGINEPFLDLLLEMSWAAGRLQREYTFLLDNFIDEDGNPVNSFWTQERRTNSASLVGRFTAELPTENPPPVPLPASILLLGAGLGGAGALSRFRRRG